MEKDVERERERERTKQEILLASPLIEGKGVRSTVWCGLTKIITAPHLVFAVTCAVRCGVVWCGLEFSQNHNRTTPHFYSHMCDTMYKTQFKVGIFLKFWAFPT